MRRRLALVSLAVTSLVVLAFLIPLATLVRNQAETRALSGAERFAQSIAAAMAVIGSADGAVGVSPALAQAVIDAFGAPSGVSIIFPDRTVVGPPVIESPNLAAAQGGAAFTARSEGGAEVLVPVLLADAPTAGETVVVRAFVADAELTRGVALAWILLAALGVFLVFVAVIAADRLGRSVVRPVTELSAAARALGGGDLETRVEPSGPEEVAEVGEAFNFLASQLGMLLSAERESVADLSHRLRTPLTALRLQAETLHDPDESASLLTDIERVERSIDRMIEEARRPSSARALSRSDLAAVVRHRTTFWKVLADEQGRRSSVETLGGELWIQVNPEELGAVVDTLIENVFAHTPAGTGYSISASPRGGGGAVLVVDDEGPGFPELATVAVRGASPGGSTGLGLDIVRRAALRTGGDLVLENRRNGGAHVEVHFGHAAETRRDRGAS